MVVEDKYFNNRNYEKHKRSLQILKEIGELELDIIYIERVIKSIKDKKQFLTRLTIKYLKQQIDEKQKQIDDLHEELLK